MNNFHFAQENWFLLLPGNQADRILLSSAVFFGLRNAKLPLRKMKVIWSPTSGGVDRNSQKKYF